METAANQPNHLQTLEAESIHILRETAATLARPVMLYSVGKDSTVMLRLAQKAFHPGAIPFPLLHVDTGYKFKEMLTFRDEQAARAGVQLIVHTNRAARAAGAHPSQIGTQRCCALLKTRALLDALAAGGFDGALGGARREEEKSRAKERIFSVRDRAGQWEPRSQRAELWNLYNTRLRPGESLRIFPLSNWTEQDIWRYIERENLPIVPLYLAREREVLARGQSLLLLDAGVEALPGESIARVMCRMRSLGCAPCTGAIRSQAGTVPEIIAELAGFRRSERENRAIDHDQEGSMELKKREGYF